MRNVHCLISHFLFISQSARFSPRFQTFSNILLLGNRWPSPLCRRIALGFVAIFNLLFLYFVDVLFLRTNSFPPAPSSSTQPPLAPVSFCALSICFSTLNSDLPPHSSPVLPSSDLPARDKRRRPPRSLSRW